MAIYINPQPARCQYLFVVPFLLKEKSAFRAWFDSEQILYVRFRCIARWTRVSAYFGLYWRFSFAVNRRSSMTLGNSADLGIYGGFE
jgi:hypothetical protein